VNPVTTAFSVFGFAATAVGLLGCATAHRLYVPPDGGEIAYLRVMDPSGRGLPGSTAIATFQKAENCEGRYFMQGIASMRQQTEVTLGHARIPAGKPFSLAINQALNLYEYCAPIIMFVPEAGRYYHVRFSTEKNSCRVALQSSESPSGRDARAETTTQLSFHNGFDENSSFCWRGLGQK